MVLHDVPFLSQFDHLTDPDWQYRGCGIVALKMVFDFWHAKDPRNVTLPLEDLLTQGLAAGAYIEKVGWSHGGLVCLAQRFGYAAFNRDNALHSVTPLEPSAVLSQLRSDLVSGPVLTSVFNKMDPERGGGHIVVVSGWDDELIYFNDPEEVTERDGKKMLAVQAFKRGFKQRTICIRPPVAMQGLRAVSEG